MKYHNNLILVHNPEIYSKKSLGPERFFMETIRKSTRKALVTLEKMKDGAIQERVHDSTFGKEKGLGGCITFSQTLTRNTKRNERIATSHLQEVFETISLGKHPYYRNWYITHANKKKHNLVHNFFKHGHVLAAESSNGKTDFKGGVVFDIENPNIGRQQDTLFCLTFSGLPEDADQGLVLYLLTKFYVTPDEIRTKYLKDTKNKYFEYLLKN